MKNIVLVAVITSIGLLVACNKKEPDSELDNKFISGTFKNLTANGKTFPREGFELIFTAVKDRNCNLPIYSLILGHYAKVDTMQEQISINAIPLNKSGKIPLAIDNKKSCDTIPYAGLSFTIGYDLLIAYYKPLRNADNYLMIDEFDKATNKIKGHFDITYTVDRKGVSYKGNYPDTVRFKVDSFETIINP
jgi:hypothetical protein